MWTFKKKNLHLINSDLIDQASSTLNACSCYFWLNEPPFLHPTTQATPPLWHRNPILHYSMELTQTPWPFPPIDTPPSNHLSPPPPLPYTPSLNPAYTTNFPLAPPTPQPNLLYNPISFNSTPVPLIPTYTTTCPLAPPPHNPAYTTTFPSEPPPLNSSWHRNPSLHYSIKLTILRTEQASLEIEESHRDKIHLTF